MKRATSYGAIPTVYMGTLFRSRLEARWAALFDLLDIEWDYEPFDLKGYVPDLLIQLKVPVLVECKPITLAAEFTAPQKKIAKSGWAGPALIVGSSLYLHPDDDLPDITARGTMAAGAAGWSRMGRRAWPAPWGPCPFGETLFSYWNRAKTACMWKPPEAPPEE
jgi:hypothetical protein